MQEHKEYIEHLRTLEKTPLNVFLEGFKNCTTYTEREEYLKKGVALEVLAILQDTAFIKAFGVEPQAVFISKKLKIEDIEELKTLVYCYNTNQRDFIEKNAQDRLYKTLGEEGFIKQKLYSLDEKEDNLLQETLKTLDRKKVICVMDVSRIGILGSTDKKERVEGTFLYSDLHNSLMLLPKRHSKRGFLIKGDFFYKER